jgi:sulfoxide reductase heme-binding subunit YedZ
MGFAGVINRFLRPVPAWPVYVAGAVLPLWLVWQAIHGGLGVDPVRTIEHRLGLWGLKLIVVALAVTPLRRFAGINLIRYRRAIGVLAFLYVALHFLAWLVLDMGLLWAQALGDVVKRPYVTLGMAALVLMTPLVLTSNDWSVRRLGAARWRKLHRLTYPAAVLGAVHYLWLVKTWQAAPIAYLAAVSVLLGVRLIPRGRGAAPHGRHGGGDPGGDSRGDSGESQGDAKALGAFARLAVARRTSIPAASLWITGRHRRNRSPGA